MSSENNSPWDDARVTAYVMGELSPDERASFETEMAADESLAEAVQQASQITNQLSTLFDAEATPPLSDSHRAAIINEPIIVRKEDEPMGRKTLIAILALAACSLLVIGLSPLLLDGSVATLSEVSKTDSRPAASSSQVAEATGETIDETRVEAIMMRCWQRMNPELAKSELLKHSNRSRKLSPTASPGRAEPLGENASQSGMRAKKKSAQLQW